MSHKTRSPSSLIILILHPSFLQNKQKFQKGKRIKKGNTKTFFCEGKKIKNIKNFKKSDENEGYFTTKTVPCIKNWKKALEMAKSFCGFSLKFS